MIAITGGTGFVGSHVVRAALRSGLTVRLIARHAGDSAGETAARVERVTADVHDPLSLEAAFRGAEAIVHLVGVIQERGRNTFEAVHHRGTVHVVEAAKAAGVGRLVHMSALGTRPNARSEYHRTKWLGEEAVRTSGLEWTIHRPSIIYGQGDGFVSRFATIARRSPVLPVPGDGRNRLQPIWAEDVATCFLQSLERAPTIGRTYELGGPHDYTMDEILDLILNALGRRRPKVHVPLRLLRPAAALLESALPAPPVTRDQLLMLEEDNVCDTNDMRHDFDVEMLDLPEGLRRMLT